MLTRFDRIRHGVCSKMSICWSKDRFVGLCRTKSMQYAKDRVLFRERDRMALTDNLANHLNQIRRRRGLSVAEFAEELGVSRSSLQSMLNGSGNPRTDTIEYIARRLETNPLILLSPECPEGMYRAAEVFAGAICTAAQLPAEQKQLILTRLLEISEMIG